VRNNGSGLLVADAIQMTSSARYNDGLPTDSVTLGPFDAIMLQR
jgi:hypothetical protein